jgi:hypothetical protein
LQNKEAAAALFRQAAERGNINALGNLGHMCAAKEGGLTDDVVAHVLLDLAAAQGSHVKKELREVAARLSAAQLEEAKTLARQWKAGEPLPLLSQTGGPFTLWTAIEALGREIPRDYNIPISKEKIERSLFMTLEERPDEKPDMFRTFASNRIDLRDSLTLSQVKLRTRDGTRASLKLDLEGACIEVAEIRQYYYFYENAKFRNMAGESVWHLVESITPWRGSMSFYLSPRNGTECLRSVTLDQKDPPSGRW